MTLTDEPTLLFLATGRRRQHRTRAFVCRQADLAFGGEGVKACETREQGLRLRRGRSGRGRVPAGPAQGAHRVAKRRRCHYALEKRRGGAFDDRGDLILLKHAVRWNPEDDLRATKRAGARWCKRRAQGLRARPGARLSSRRRPSAATAAAAVTATPPPLQGRLAYLPVADVVTVRASTGYGQVKVQRPGDAPVDGPRVRGRLKRLGTSKSNRSPTRFASGARPG